MANIEAVDRLTVRSGDWLQSFLTAMEAATEAGQAGETALEDAVVNLAQIRATAEATRPLRPWTGVLEQAKQIPHCMGDVATHYLHALVADTPVNAQLLARQGQAAIDRASERLAIISAIRARMERLSVASTVAQRLQLSFRELYATTGAGSLLALSRTAGALYNEFGGTLNALPVPAALILGVMDVEASTFLDRRRFVAIGQEVVTALRRQQSKVSAAFRNDIWLRNLKDATERFFDAAVDYNALISAARHDRDSVRAIVGLGHTLIEGPGRRFLALVLASLGSRPLEKLLAADAFAVVDMARQAGLGSSANGFVRALRHAKAHEAWEFDGTRIHLSPNTPPIDPGEMIDDILALAESVAGIQCGLVVALVDAEVPEAAAFPTFDLGFTTEEMVALVLELACLGQCAISLKGSDLFCECRGDLEQHNVSIAAMLTPWLPEQVEQVHITARSDTSVQVLSGPVEPLRRFSRSVEELQHGADFVDACAQWTLDAKPLVSSDHVRKWIAMQAAAALKDPEPKRTRSLRFLMRFSEERGLPEFASALSTTIALSRNLALGIPDSGGSERLAPLIEWEGKKLEGPFA